MICTQQKETPMTDQVTFVGPDRVAEKMARARGVPGVAESSAQVRAAMDEADLIHAHNLAPIRKPPT
jgi:hypothetical protein